MAENPALLRIDDLHVAYRTHRHGQVQAVNGVSLSVEPGELVSIVGESGSGKSTIARAALGLLGPVASVQGRVELDGNPLLGLTERQWRAVRGREIAFVPQDPGASLDPTRPVGKQIAEAVRIHDRTQSGPALRARVVELLDRVGIPDPAHRARQYPHELSGGMRQRVLIAAALANGPRLIVADEPTSALDVTVQQQILDHVDELRRDLGLAVLLITHDLGVAGERSDRVVVLEHGQVVEQGPADRILRRPEARYTRMLVAAVPRVDHGRLVHDAALGRTRPARSTDPLLDAATAPVLLRAGGLNKTFPGRGGAPVHAVLDVDVAVPRGGTLGVVGESGSGKSTLARLLTRLAPVDSGEITLDGEDITHARGEVLRQLRRRVQIVYQNPFVSLDPRFDVGRSVAEPLRAFRIGSRAERDRRVRELLTQVGLPAEVAQRRPAQLSGGQLQRVAIARALATSPELVVLDEAVSALDVSVQAQILDLLVRLQAELGVTLLFISHDLAVVRQVSDAVLVMNGGRVVESGPADAVLGAPQSPYTQALLRAVPGRGARGRTGAAARPELDRVGRSA